MQFGWKLDGYMGLAVAIFILWSGWGLVKDSIAPLLGQTPDPELVRHIADVLTFGKADAALAASIFHYGEIPIPSLKRQLYEQHITVRL